MDLEARSLQPSMKATLLAKLREYKTDLNNLKNELKRVTSANANITARDELLELGRIDSLAVYLLAILPRILIGVYLFELRV
jgi:vesicle transport through interaction with t-SNAREs 1